MDRATLEGLGLGTGLVYERRRPLRFVAVDPSQFATKNQTRRASRKRKYKHQSEINADYRGEEGKETLQDLYEAKEEGVVPRLIEPPFGFVVDEYNPSRDNDYATRVGRQRTSSCRITRIEAGYEGEGGREAIGKRGGDLVVWNSDAHLNLHCNANRFLDISRISAISGVHPERCKPHRIPLG